MTALRALASTEKGTVEPGQGVGLSWRFWQTRPLGEAHHADVTRLTTLGNSLNCRLGLSI